MAWKRLPRLIDEATFAKYVPDEFLVVSSNSDRTIDKQAFPSIM